MDAYCPRCKVSLTHVDEATLLKGRCPTCDGQINLGGVTAGGGPAGAIAMTFAAGSRVAVALDASFETAQLDLGGTATGRRPPPPPPDAELPAHLGLPMNLSAASDELTVVPGAELERSEDLPRPRRRPAAPPPPPMNDEPTAPASFSFDNAPTVANAPLTAAPPPPPETPEPVTPDPAPSPAPARSPASKAEPSPVLGAHLQLPAIDFSMPDLGTMSAELPPAPATSGAPADLPAHLQLPSFPDFHLPPIPGQETEQRDGELEIKGVPGGTFSAMQDTEVTAPAPVAGKAEDWAVAQGGQPPVPPPLPATPPPLKPKAKPPAAAADALPDLPPLGLPALKAATPARDPTLLQSEAAQALVADLHRKRFSLGLFIAVLLVIALAGVGGTLAYFGPNTVASWFITTETTSVGPSKRDLADEKLVAGKKAYLAGEEAEKAKKADDAKARYGEAIGLFEAALKIDPSYGQVHRNLGIAFAKTNQHARAVEHYELYLKKVRDAADRPAVSKIIDDYRKAKDKKKGK